MKKLIAILAALTFAPAAFAADSEVSHNAEYRMRYTNDTNQGYSETGQAYFNHRFKVGLTYRAGEKFSAHTSILHNNMWGMGRSAATHPSDFGSLTSGSQAFLVNQAYASWMVSDDFMIKSGRMAVEFGDGTIFAENDYEDTPYSFDGLNFAYDTEFAHVDFFFLRTAETAKASNTAVTDNEEDWYALSVDIKSLPEVLKMVNIHLIQYLKENEPTDATRASSMDLGLTLGGDAGGLDYRLTYATQSGKTGPAATEATTKGTMMDLEVGFSMPAVMNSRIALGYHDQSGDDATTPESENYVARYYDKHNNSGLMDVVNWNTIDGTNTTSGLNDIFLVYSMSPSEDYHAQIQYHQFSFVKEVATKKALGTELDLEAKKKYDSGLEITARYGMFTPGEAIKTPTTDKTYSKVYLQGKFTF